MKLRAQVCQIFVGGETLEFFAGGQLRNLIADFSQFFTAREGGNHGGHFIAPVLPKLGGQFGFAFDLGVLKCARHRNGALFAQGGAQCHDAFDRNGEVQHEAHGRRLR